MRPICMVLLGTLAVALLGGPAAVGSDASPEPTRGGGDPTAVVVLTPEAVERAQALEQFIRDYEATWAAHDVDAFAAFLSDETFLFEEPRNRIETKEAFVAFMGPFVTTEHVLGASDFRFHVGADEAVESYQVWGFLGATEEDPLVEVDLFTVRDDRITSLRSMYEADLLRQELSIDPTELIARYETAWSSSDPALIEALYAEDAVRVDALYGVELNGRDAIGRDAASLLERHPGARSSVIGPYIFGDETVAGTVLVLDDDTGCDLEYTVLLETDEAGAITRERVYHDIASITRCDWQR